MDESLFRLYSFGIAAENKDLHSYQLAVTPIEITQFLNGELNSIEAEEESAGLDANGEAYKTKVTTSTSLPCKWMPYGSNRVYPPDIRRGERIFIFTYGDTGEFYWKETGLDDNLRRLETVVYRFSATQEENVELGPDNSYWLEVSTHKKKITLKTTKANGEPFEHYIQLDTEKGNLVYQDDIGNFINVDSSENNLHLQNADNSRIEIDKTKIYIQSDDLVEVETTKMHIKTKTLLIESDEIIEKCKTRTLEADSNSIKATTTHQGDITNTGAVTNTGDLTNTGDFTETGNTTFTGMVMANGKKIDDTHTHSPPGGPVA